MASDKVRIGKIVGCHGLRGDFKVRPASEEADWTDSIKQVYLKDAKSGQERLVHVQSARQQGPMVYLRFQEFADRTQAEPFVGSVLYAEMKDLPEPEQGEYWADDLIGLSVMDAQTGRQRGTVKDLLSSGGSDFLEIQLEDSAETVVIPFINHFFPVVDVKNGTIAIDLLSDFLSIATTPVTADRLEQ